MDLNQKFEDVLTKNCKHHWRTLRVLDKFNFEIKKIKTCDKCGERKPYSKFSRTSFQMSE